MAEQLTPEEIQRAFDAYNEELLRTGQVSRETANAFKDANAGIRNYTYNLNQSLKQLGQASLDLTSKLAKGEQGAGIYNDSIKSGANAIDTFASKFGIWGNIIGTAVNLLAKYVTAAAEQSDKLFGTYQQLSKVGAAGAGNLLDMVHQLGYTIKDLDQFSNFVKKNAETLALYNGTVYQGTTAFAKVTQGFKDSGLQTQLRLMGLQIEDINQGIAGYQRIQVLSGSTQRKTTAELVQGSAEYIKQLDIVTKLTGKSAEAQQAETEARMNESAYLATRMEIQGKADQARMAGDEATAKHFEGTLVAMETMLKQVPTELQSGVKGLLTGYAGGSKAGMATFRAASGAATELLNVKNQGLTVEGGQAILDRLKQEGTANARRNLNLYQFQDKGDEFFGQLSGFTKIGEERAKAAKDAEDEQKKQKTSPNDMVKSQVSMRQAQESTTRASEAFVNLGVKPATSALETLTDVIDTLSDTLLPGSSAARGKAAPAPKTAPTTTGPSGPGGARPSGSSGTRSLLDIIGQGESGGNYNALVGGGEANLTNMTIAEVQKLQKTMLAQGRASSAVGKYQMISDTLAEQVKKAGLDPNRTKFDQGTQDLLASQLVGQAGYGRKDSATVMKNLAGTWASLPQDMSGRGRYDGYNTNRANINPNDLLAAIQSGPKDRYSPALASISSNIPKTVVPGFDSTVATTERKNSDDMQRITIAKLDELITLQRANNAQNQKMIQHARS
jgi:muramidase (phage lysozyme)